VGRLLSFNKYFLLFAFLVFIKNAGAQISAGLKGGLSISNFSNTPEVGFNQLKAGYNTGIFVSKKLLSFSHIQGELLYNSKGRNDEFHRYNLSYIDLPVLLKIKIKNIDIHGGAYFSYLASAEVKQKIMNGSIELHDLNRKNFAPIDYGFCYGAGFRKDIFFFGFRFLKGKNEIPDDPILSSKLFNIKGARNSTGQIYMGLIIF
jgi:hypothetical protein